MTHLSYQFTCLMSVTKATKWDQLLVSVKTLVITWKIDLQVKYYGFRKQELLKYGDDCECWAIFYFNVFKIIDFHQVLNF